FYLDIALPYVVDSDRAKARFDKKFQRLSITFPVTGNKARGTTEGVDAAPSTTREEIPEQNAQTDSIEDVEEQGDAQSGPVDAAASDEIEGPRESAAESRAEFIEAQRGTAEEDEPVKAAEVIEIGFDSAEAGAVVENNANVDFVASDAFDGPRPGYYYGSGPEGLGYHSDPQSARAREVVTEHTGSPGISLSTTNLIETVKEEEFEGNEEEVDSQVAAPLAEMLPEVCLLCEESMSSSATLAVTRERQTWLNVMLSIGLPAAEANERFVRAHIRELRPRWLRIEVDTDARRRHRETFHFHGSVDVKQGVYTELSHGGKEMILVLAKAQKGEEWDGGIASKADGLTQEDTHSVVVEPGLAKSGEGEAAISVPEDPNHAERDESDQAGTNELDVEPSNQKAPEESNPAAALLGQSLRLRSTLHWVLLRQAPLLPVPSLEAKTDVVLEAGQRVSIRLQPGVVSFKPFAFFVHVATDECYGYIQVSQAPYDDEPLLQSISPTPTATQRYESTDADRAHLRSDDARPRRQLALDTPTITEVADIPSLSRDEFILCRMDDGVDYCENSTSRGWQLSCHGNDDPQEPLVWHGAEFTLKRSQLQTFGAQKVLLRLQELEGNLSIGLSECDDLLCVCRRKYPGGKQGKKCCRKAVGFNSDGVKWNRGRPVQMNTGNIQQGDLLALVLVSAGSDKFARVEVGVSRHHTPAVVLPVKLESDAPAGGRLVLRASGRFTIDLLLGEGSSSEASRAPLWQALPLLKEEPEAESDCDMPDA
ncbi:PIH1 domain containing, partial [Perkinsus chesapeaki]